MFRRKFSKDLFLVASKSETFCVKLFHGFRDVCFVCIALPFVSERNACIKKFARDHKFLTGANKLMLEQFPATHKIYGHFNREWCQNREKKFEHLAETKVIFSLAKHFHFRWTLFGVAKESNYFAASATITLVWGEP